MSHFNKGSLPFSIVSVLADCQIARQKAIVNKISEIVHQIQGLVVHSTPQEPEEIAEGIDGPTRCYNETHSVEGRLHMLAHFVASGGHLSGLAQEDLEKNKCPSSHPNLETKPSVDNPSSPQ